MSNQTIKQWAAAATLAGITLTTVSGQQLIETKLINDTNFANSSTTAYTYTIATGTYFNIFTNNLGASAGPGRLFEDGNNLRFGANSAQVTLYRPFDGGYSLKLGDMQIGDSLSLSFTAKVYGIGSVRSFAYGFISNPGNSLAAVTGGVAPVYVLEDLKSYTEMPSVVTNSTFRYADSGIDARQLWANDNGGTALGEPVKIERLADGSTNPDYARVYLYTTTFTINAVAGGYTLGLKLYDETAGQLVSDFATPPILSWGADMLQQDLTGFAMHVQEIVMLSSLQVSYFSAIPEPATWALWLGGAALLLSLRRRR